MVVKSKTKTKMWPVLKSCKDQCYAPNDRLSPLPDDLLFFIMSFLTMKDVARISVLSHRCNYLWRCFPVLIFEDLPAMKRRVLNFKDREFESRERLHFLKRVNTVLESHRGCCVDKFRVTFGLHHIFQSDINKWLIFAIAKQVKRLELNFKPALPTMENRLLLNWCMPLDLSQNSSFFKSCLRSLSLSFVNITTKDVDCLLCSCMVLENLCIVSSPTLKYVRAIGLPPQLKHLKLCYCDRLKDIDILAPKLLSFKYHGEPVKLHIRSAPMLSKLSFGVYCGGDFVTHFFSSQSNYLPQLEYLSLKMRMYVGTRLSNCVQYNLGIDNPPAMKNLKHLKLDVYALCDQSLLRWAELIEASPVLERLTLIVQSYGGKLNRKMMKRNGRPLKSLKTLELCNHIGLPIDLEFFTYVVENSIMLKDVIVELSHLGTPLSKDFSVRDQVAEIRQIVPEGANFTLRMPNL